jgi:hypothetical protein
MRKTTQTHVINHQHIYLILSIYLSIYLYPGATAQAASSSNPKAEDSNEPALAFALPGSREPSQPVAQAVHKTLCVDPDGSYVVVKVSKGTIVATVELQSPNLRPRDLGIVKQMVDFKTGRVSLQAVCRLHSRCICWVSNQQNSDLLCQWLESGRKENRDSHQKLAKELKVSIGMKVTT